ncbi:hypothetical protein [Halobacterium noricense]|uniref:hypothetical protein n=1 Tax=Halobacterium noricense TaxID=223182 RepID=UPI001E5632F4|nr:hypothetical protein [Halobacterium noricense]UHH24599.1 hypothetical protein LT974_11465 [Halobacterium noricense]
MAFGALVVWDTRRAESWLHAKFGRDGPHVAVVGVVALLFGGILPDLMTSGVNLFFPLHDRFYTFAGSLELSSTEGVVQTFVDLERGSDPANAERVFPVVSSGFQLVVVLTAIAGVVGRFREAKR